VVSSGEKRPNILLIMTDQQRGDCLGVEDHPVLLTPNMDSIAGAGARFSKCYSTCPVCIPARRSLLSGQFPSTHGIVGYHENIEWDAGQSLVTPLQRAGYHTFLAGRNMHQHPPAKRYGFDHMVENRAHYRPWLEDQLPHRSHQPAGDYYASGVMHNDWTARPWHLDEQLHQTNWTVNEALRFLGERDPSCPYFLVVSFLAPHPPLVPPAFYMDRYLRQDLPAPVIGDWAVPPPDGGRGRDVSNYRVDLRGEALKSCRAGYYGLINHIDDQIRRLLNPVDSRMDRDNTIVLFTSDHGEMLGDHHFFRKSLPYEPSARIPLLLSAPARYGLATGQVIDAPVCLEDVMPTVLDMAGLDIPDHVDGTSLLPLLRGEAVDWRDYVHIEHGGAMNDHSHQTLTDGREKFIWFTGAGEEQFFDLTADPGERQNLVGSPDHRERVALWRGRLIETLSDRPEGFVAAGRLVAGRPYPDLIVRAGP